MILTVNIENGKIFIGCAEEKGRTIVFEEAISTDLRKTPAEYSIMISQLLSLYNVDRLNITGGIISSCVPQVTKTVRRAISQLLDTDVLEVGPGIKTGVDIRIDDPGELGADMLAAAAAAISDYGYPLSIINLGTVGTISVIDEKGRFAGCLIFPGVSGSLDNLARSAASLPGVAAAVPAKLIGTTTVESMQSGVVNGTAALIDGLLDRIKSELGVTEMKTPIITGEFAGLLLPCCSHELRLDRHLMMKGLVIIYNKNRKQRG